MRKWLWRSVLIVLWLALVVTICKVFDNPKPAKASSDCPVQSPYQTLERN